MIRIGFAQETALTAGMDFRFTGGRAVCPDGVTRVLKRVAGEGAELISGTSVRCAVEAHGKTVTGSVVIVPPNVDERASALTFAPDPTLVNAAVFA